MHIQAAKEKIALGDDDDDEFDEVMEVGPLTLPWNGWPTRVIIAPRYCYW